VTVDWPEPGSFIVLCDFQDGAQQATVHLLEDRRRISLITFALDIPIAQQI
jgi:DNA-binding LacI/PurR family transcriptional regulator